MSLAAPARTFRETVRATLSVFVTLAGVSCGLTLLYLGMRSVMDVGGACASGGPYVPRAECPEGVPLLMIGGIWGGLIFVGLYLWSTTKHGVPTLVGFAWPALFLSLGWNFVDYGIDPPAGEGLVWGWLICALLFALMGGLPLLGMVKPIMAQFGRGASEAPPARVIVPTRSKVKELRAAGRPGGGAPQRFGFDPEPPTGGGEPLVDALERLGALHRAGSLSDSEFEAAKRRVLQGEV